MTTEAAKVYQEVLDLILKAEATQAVELSFESTELRELLTELPPEIQRLTALQMLDICGCFQIADLARIHGLSALRTLDVSECKRISDLKPIRGLAALQTLNLRWCDQITDLTPIRGLSALETLDISGCKRISDLKPIRGLTALQRLDISWCEQIPDLTPISGLTALQRLDISRCEQIPDLTPISGLTALQTLGISGCQQISDLTPISGLGALQALDISGFWGPNQITDLRPISGHRALQRLNISRCEQIPDLTPISGLRALQRLNISGCKQIPDLKPISGLAALQTLVISGCEQITDLEPISGLTALQTLDISGCEQITDLEPISGLTALQTLDISGCERVTDFTPLIPLLPTLNALSVFGTPWADLPPEVCGEYSHTNALPQIRAHFEDLKSGAAANTEVKVLILGNGSAGKTQLARRLRGLAFDETIPTTHGIELNQSTLDLEGTPFQINLWDFGGQEIYHGSHALFLQGQCIFLVLWTPELEQTTPYLDHGIAMRNRPLSYWLDYIRAFAGLEAPVVVIQSRCDQSSQRIRDLPAPLTEFQSLQATQASAKTGLGLDSVKAALKEAVRDCVDRRPPPPIGLGRSKVRARLREMLSQQGPRRRWLERGEFDQLCAEQGGVSDTESLLAFLHHSGVIFYRPGLFGDRVILDQNWALEAIYTLFDRKKIFPLRRGYGRFSRADLEFLIWRDYTPDEQEIFLGMMQSCGICFQVNPTEFIAPELLPAWSEAQQNLLAGRLRDTPPQDEMQVDFPFLHDGVLRNYLSRIGRIAGDAAIYWKYGCWFYERTTDSQLLLESHWLDAETQTGPGHIRLRAWGPRAAELIDSMSNELSKLPTNQMPQSTRKTPDPRPLESLQVVEAIQPPAGKPAAYVSYAWGDNKTEEGRQRGEVVDGLCASLDADGWEVIRDRDTLRYGDLISDFMKRLTRADRIILVISAKYLQSPACMTEIYGIYQRSTGDKQDFLSRVIPLTLGEVKLFNWRDRAETAKYWQTEFQEMEKSVSHLSAADLCLYKAMQDWHNRVGDILAHVADTLHPHGFDDIKKDNFAALPQMLASARDK